MDYNDNRYDRYDESPVNELTPLIDYEDLSHYELTPEEKNSVSHRARAFAKMRELMQENGL